jgi:hypothetical protein
MFDSLRHARRLFLPILLGAVPLAAEAEAKPSHPVTLVPVSKVSQSQKLTLLALQGLTNRNGPNVFLDFGDDNRWMSMDYTEKPQHKDLLSWNPNIPKEFKAKYPTTGKAWVEILTKQSKFEFKSQPWEMFLAQAGKDTAGWIVYDHFEDEVALVGTLAGQKDALPVLRQDLAAMQKILPGLPVVFDTKTIPTIPEVGRKVSVHRWMIENLLPHVNKTGIVSRVKNYGLQEHDTYVDIDQAVQEKWLVYDLTHYREDTADKPDPKWSRPHEAAALLEILKSYPPLTPVFGWGAIDENTFVRVITENGLTVICSGVPNNSFFNRWKASRLPFKQRHSHVAESDVKVEDKVYLAFMVNEGDQWHNPEQKVDFKMANYPVAFSNHYYTLKDPEVFARMLIEDYKDVKGPWFVIVYGANRHMTPYKAKTLMDHLPAGRFKAVLLDEFFTAARLARKEIEGKVWRPGPDAPKGVAP